MCGDRLGIEIAVAVDDDLVPGRDALGLEQTLDLGPSTVSSQAAGNATAPGTWPPRGSPFRRQPL